MSIKDSMIAALGAIFIGFSEYNYRHDLKSAFLLGGISFVLLLTATLLKVFVIKIKDRIRQRK